MVYLPRAGIRFGADPIVDLIDHEKLAHAAEVAIQAAEQRNAECNRASPPGRFCFKI